MINDSLGKSQSGEKASPTKNSNQKGDNQDDKHGEGYMSQEGKKENQVYTYTAPWNIYAMGFSSRPDKKYRMGIGSFLEDVDNKIEIIQLDDNLEGFEVKGSFTHKYPPTK